MGTLKECQFLPATMVYSRTYDAPVFNPMSMGRYVSLVPVQSLFRDAEKYLFRPSCFKKILFFESNLVLSAYYLPAAALMPVSEG
jgi:hypothetical protein